MTCPHEPNPNNAVLYCSACEDERKGIEADARRYRFIRTHSEALQRIGRRNLMMGTFDEDLDAAIDTAMGIGPSGVPLK